MKPITCAWSPELEDLSQYHKVFPAEQFPALIQELTSMAKLPQGEDVLNRARRLLEIIVIDLCKTDWQRERGTEPLKGILDKFAKDKVIPENIISSMYNINELGKYGSHPKDFDEQRQVREALLSLVTVLHWYAKHRGLPLPAHYSNAIIEQETRSYELEMVSGAIPLDSNFYVQRPVDQEFQAAIARRDTIVLLKGPRQVGKTSLLARGLQQARKAEVQVLLTDFQKLIPDQLKSLESLFLALGDMLADQLNLDVYPQDKWRPGRAPNMNFDSYFRREILAKTQQPILWAMDEADRLFSCEFSSEVFALFRTWHNERALNPSTPCNRLTLVLAYATETYLFIKDPNQSPFNVGTKLLLEDFTLGQVADLNQRYGQPLHNDTELPRFYHLVGGQPYLVRCGLNDMVNRHLTLDQFIRQAAQEDGAFGDHLRRILMLLKRDPHLCDAIRGVLRDQPCPDDDSFSLLRRVGILKGDCKNEVRLRCEIYATYLKKHLL